MVEVGKTPDFHIVSAVNMLKQAFLHVMVTKAKWGIRNSELMNSEGMRLLFKCFHI